MRAGPPMPAGELAEWLRSEMRLRGLQKTRNTAQWLWPVLRENLQPGGLRCFLQEQGFFFEFHGASCIVHADAQGSLAPCVSAGAVAAPSTVADDGSVQEAPGHFSFYAGAASSSGERGGGAPVVFEGAAAGDGNEEGSGPAAIASSRGGVQAHGFPAAAKSSVAPTEIASAELPRASEATGSKNSTAPSTVAAGVAAGVQALGAPAAAKSPVAPTKIASETLPPASEAKGSKDATAPTTVTAGAPAGVQAPGAPAAAELPRAREAKSSKDATAPTTIAAGAAAGSAAAGSAAAAAAPSAQANERGGIRAPGACLSAPCASTAHALAAYLRPARPTPAVPNASNAPAELLRPTLASGGAADAPTASAETGVHAQAPSVSAGVATLLPGAGPRDAAAAAPSFSDLREVMNRRRQEREGRGDEDESGRAVSWWWGRYGAHAEAWWYRTESGEWRKDGAGRSFQFVCVSERPDATAFGSVPF